MTRYMLDTNTVSQLVRGNPQVASRLVAQPMAALCISAVTEGELRFGLARRPAATRLHSAVEEFLRRVAVLPWDSAVAQRYGALRADMEGQGKPLGPLDMMIAAHALERDAVLATNDSAFSQVRGLGVVDWTE